MNGASYTYRTKPHAVTAVGNTTYAYDANGNMTTRGSQTLTWDAENRLVGVSDNGTTMSAVYDGDGNRVKKTEGSSTVLYVNRFYEKDLSSSVETTHYYLGGREVAYRKGTAIEYVCQDHLGSTVLTVDSSGGTLGTVAYSPFGATRSSSGALNTDELFTGQRLDQTGLYYYGARYYDATIGRFISADSIVQSVVNPQCLNRYSYCINNPLRYSDPTGHFWKEAMSKMKEGLQAPQRMAEEIAEKRAESYTGGVITGVGYEAPQVEEAGGGLVSAGDLATAGGILTVGAAVDGPVPIGDIIGGLGAAGYLIYQAVTSENSWTKTETTTRTRTQSQRQNVTYQLVAKGNKETYPVYRFGIKTPEPVKMHAGEVWKYGVTSRYNPVTKRQWRYSEKWLAKNDLEFQVVYPGPDRLSCLAFEKQALATYMGMNGWKLPPGNRMFR